MKNVSKIVPCTYFMANFLVCFKRELLRADLVVLRKHIATDIPHIFKKHFLYFLIPFQY